MAKWTEEEEEFLRGNYKDYTDKELAEKINKRFNKERTKRSIIWKKRKLNLSKYNKWNNDEVQFLIDNYDNFQYSKLADIMSEKFNSKFTEGSINIKLKRLGIVSGTNNAEWSNEEVNFLVNNYKNLSNKELVKILNNKFDNNRSESSVKYKKYDLGLRRVNNGSTPSSMKGPNWEEQRKKL
jgi:hypothetical protein